MPEHTREDRLRERQRRQAAEATATLNRARREEAARAAGGNGLRAAVGKTTQAARRAIEETAREQVEEAGRVFGVQPAPETPPPSPLPPDVEEVGTFGGTTPVFRGRGAAGEVAFADRPNIATLTGGEPAPLPEAARIGERQVIAGPTAAPFGRPPEVQAEIERRVAASERGVQAIRELREAQPGVVRDPITGQLGRLPTGPDVGGVGRGLVGRQRALTREEELQSTARGLAGEGFEQRQAAREELRGLRAARAEIAKEERQEARDIRAESREMERELITIQAKAIGERSAAELRREQELSDDLFAREQETFGPVKASTRFITRELASRGELDPRDPRTAEGIGHLKFQLNAALAQTRGGPIWRAIRGLADLVGGVERATVRGEAATLDLSRYSVVGTGDEMQIEIAPGPGENTPTRIDVDDIPDPATRETLIALIRGGQQRRR